MTILVERDNIGIFGVMNAGKSSVMNLITQQKTSIVDSHPGTTADTKVSLHEIHGIGPVRIFDTAGLDESSNLGEKKKDKAFNDLKESDLVLLIIDPSRKNFETEELILEKARNEDKQILIVYNIFNNSDVNLIKDLNDKMKLLRFHKEIIINAHDNSYRKPLIDFILQNYIPKNSSVELLPFIKRDEFYILIIPMDEETPTGRLLRPQAMTEEYITRHWAYPVSFRLNLAAARENNEEKAQEFTRYNNFLKSFSKKPKAMITDSQAMDIMKDWCPEDIDLTTFSIVMINYISGGRLQNFIQGIDTLSTIKDGDSILIAEACNHDRIAEDIGTVQIPNIIKKKFPEIKVDHAFGKEFHDKKDLEKYSLIIHCGGCMISNQKLSARIRDLDALNIPYTNYGIFLSAVQGEGSLKKVLKPWNLSQTR
jgi:[FeFe] hydrogenase H-cluster maturation GTPase HydF